MSDLEQTWEEVAAQINAKLKEAAALIHQANELSAKANVPALINTQWLRDNISYDEPNLTREQLTTRTKEVSEKIELIDVGDLENELGQAGWSTSASYC